MFFLFAQPFLFLSTGLLMATWLLPSLFIPLRLILATVWMFEIKSHVSFLLSKNKNFGAVVISGASTGIGRETALHLASKGHTVFAGVRKNEDGEALLKESRALEKKGALIPIILDVSIDESVSKAFAQISAHPLVASEGLLAVINNAGIGHESLPVEAFSIEKAKQIMDVNVFGSIRLNSAALPLLRRWNGLDDENSTQEFPEKTSSSNKKKKHQIPSRVIFISSGSGLLGAPFSAVYSSSKFALEGLADAFRAEVFPQNIHVSVINPGMTQPCEIYHKMGFGPHGGSKYENILESLNVLPQQIQRYYTKIVFKNFSMIQQVVKSADHVTSVAHVVEHAVVSPSPRMSYILPAARSPAILSMLPKAFQYFLVKKLLG